MTTIDTVTTTAEERAAILGAVREYAETELAPFAAERDEKHLFPRDALRKAGELGLGGIYVREESGGSGLSRVDTVAIFEELAKGDPAVAAYISIHNMVVWMIDTYGDDAQRARWMPELTAMTGVGSYCLTEPGAGSDAAALATSATRDGDEYVLTGVKQFISGAGEAAVYIVMARTGQPGAHGICAFLVPDGADGLSFGALEKKMGWHAQPTRQVILDGVRGPATSMLGSEGQGFAIAMSALNGGRLNIAACSLGGAQWALDRAVAVRARARGVRRAARREAVDPVRRGRHAHRSARRAADGARRRAGRRRQGSGCDDALRDGQAVRDRRRIRRREQGPSAARRLRVSSGLRDREGRP